MLHWHHTMVNGVEFWIIYQRLAFLSILSCWKDEILPSQQSFMCWGPNESEAQMSGAQMSQGPKWGMGPNVSQPFWNEFRIHKSLLMKSSQSNSNLRSPSSYLVRSYLFTTAVYIVLISSLLQFTIYSLAIFANIGSKPVPSSMKCYVEHQ
jgi:hypothetical protein